MEVKSNGCFSFELIFDFDFFFLLVIERFLLDFEGLNEDDFNLEDENCVLSSFDIIFDFDIFDDLVVD